ncbi:MAG: hypothetical protein FVQ80_11550 [Planctomycetes bacterium]|nr:hypothetical protein [Planctomycetota bacterium]
MTRRVNRPYLKLGAKVIVYSTEKFIEIDKLIADNLTIKEMLVVLKTSRTTLYRNMIRHLGNTKWNELLRKFKKRRGAQPGKHYSPATEFKKGQLTGINQKRLQPIGTTMVKKQRYGQGKKQFRLTVFIKINNIPYGNYGVNWVLYSRYLWIKWNGSIPKRKCIVHLDMDHTNFGEDNLACMSLPEYRRYLEARFPEKLARRIRRMAASKRRQRVEARAVKLARKERAIA